MVKFKYFSRPLSVFQVLFKANFIFKDFSKTRALTPLFGNGAGALGIGKISCVSTKIGKIYIVYMYEVSIARLIQIVNLSLFLENIY